MYPVYIRTSLSFIFPIEKQNEKTFDILMLNNGNSYALTGIAFKRTTEMWPTLSRKFSATEFDLYRRNIRLQLTTVRRKVIKRTKPDVASNVTVCCRMTMSN